MTETYLTVADRAQVDFEIKGSTFLGHVAPADSVAEAEAFVEEVRDAHADASHNVPAYRVPAEGNGDAADAADVADVADAGGGLLREWASDDGEPTGSAGKPARNVLVQRDLRNVVAVVTRYYGGVNLGVGGLARAYARSVSDAVDAAGVVEERPHERLAITVDYDDSGTVRGILESEAVEFDADYEARVHFAVRVPAADAAALRDRLRSATGGRVELG